MPFVFPARYQMEFAESAPLEVERFPLLSFQFIDFITLQKFSKGQSFITRLLFTGEKGAERLTLSMYLDVQNPSHRLFVSATAQLIQLLEIQRMVAYLLNKYLTICCSQTRPWTLRQHEALYKLAQMDMEGRIPDNGQMSLEASVFRTIHPLKWSIHTLLQAVRKVIAFYSLQHRPKLAGLLFHLRYYRVIFSNGYSSHLKYMKFIDNAELMLNCRHNVLGYNVVMEMLEEQQEEEDKQYGDYDNA
ncbi:hypothetical protein BXZ70DRAFT_911586 [Cristinia sonorae]|uniref:Uncharacterized protein n=1 Tax=Cristinia sonorae TaxID=1940300 RepID=A0A8K0UD06_9AGAR|nr:hypothetical protein BXZ70DRAFT_911586 [Cristinia sonorae]